MNLLILPVFLLMLVVNYSCSSDQPAKTDYTPLARAFVSVWNTGDGSALDTLLTSDFVRHSSPVSVAGAEVVGIENMKLAVLKTREALSDFNFQVEEFIGLDSVMIMRCQLSGIFNQTGRPVDVGSIHILKFRSGRIAEHYGCLDHLDLYLQAGMKVVPPDDKQ